jgi:hypothetical protein
MPVAFQAGQLTDPEYRATPSLAAAVVAMAGGIPEIPQFRPHEEVSDQYMILLCFHFVSVCISVLRIHDILVWIRIRIWIRGFMPLINGSGCGSGSCYLRHWPQDANKKLILNKSFSAGDF